MGLCYDRSMWHDSVLYLDPGSSSSQTQVLHFIKTPKVFCLSCVKVTKPVSPFAVSLLISFSSHCDIIVIGIGKCFGFDQQKSPPEAIPTYLVIF